MQRRKSGVPAGLVVALVACALSFGGPLACASSTTITSEPAAAKVRVDGVVLGQTPVEFHEGSVWVWTKHQVTLEKPGFETTTRMMQADFITVNLIVGICLGLLCLIPGVIALVGEYKPQYHFVMQQKAVADALGAMLESASVDFAE